MCDDLFEDSNHGAQVVCRELGWNRRNGPAGTMYAPHNVQPSLSQVAASTVPIKLDNVACTGNETSILYCAHAPVGVHKSGNTTAVDTLRSSKRRRCSHVFLCLCASCLCALAASTVLTSQWTASLWTPPSPS